MKLEEVLQTAGLSEIEARTYLFLLSCNGSSVSNISKNINVQRTRLYPILRSLTYQSFAMLYYRNGKKIFHAAKPEKIFLSLKKKMNTLKSAMPLLDSLTIRSEEVFGLRQITSQSELQQCYIDTVDQYARKTVCVLGSIKYWESLVSHEFAEQYRRGKNKRGMHTKLITTHESKILLKFLKNPRFSIHILPSELTFKSIFHIFPDKIIISTPNSEALAVVLAVPAMVDIFQSVFNLLWDITTTKIKSSETFKSPL